MKDEKSTSKTRNMVKNPGKLGKNSTVGLEIWQKKLKNVENEKQTLHDLEYGEKTEKHGKLENHTVGS